MLIRRWSQFRDLVDLKKESLHSALGVQNYHLDCNETKSWIREKTKVIESTQELGNDLTGVMALQRKLTGMERDLAAIETKLGDLRGEAERLGGEHPDQAKAITGRLAEITAVWEEMKETLRNREASLGEASKLQQFLREVDDFQSWLSRTQTAIASEDMPNTLAEAEKLLAQHEGIKNEINNYEEDYQKMRDMGEMVTQGQTDAQYMFLRQRLQALDTGWNELHKMWENRQNLLSQSHAYQIFLRDTKQAEAFLNNQVSRLNTKTKFPWRTFKIQDSLVKRGSLENQNVLHTKKKIYIFRTVHWNVLWETQKWFFYGITANKTRHITFVIQFLNDFKYFKLNKNVIFNHFNYNCTTL